MAYEFSPSWTGSATLQIPAVPLDSATLATKQDEPAEVIQTNTTSPIDRPEIWTFGSRQVADVYKDTPVTPAAKPASSRGVQLMIKHDSVTQVTSTTDPNYLKQFPMVSWVCIRVPVNEFITSDMVLQEFQRLLGGCFLETTGDVTSARLGELIRGALKA